MGRERIIRYNYDDELYEMLPSSQSQASLQDMRWTNFTDGVINDAKEYNTLWNEDFSHRPSWCDARLALQQIKRGRAKGNKPALYLRAFLQIILFKLGCLIQRRSLEVLFIGVLVLCLFTIGLRNAVIETDMEKLWVQKGGKMDEERSFVKKAFSDSAGPSLAAFDPTTSSTSLPTNLHKDRDTNNYANSHITKDTTNLHNNNGEERIDELFGGGNTVQYLVLIQTQRKKGDKIHKEDLLLHEQALRNVSQLSIDMYGEKWSLADICFKPSPPQMPDSVKSYFERFLNAIIPCVIITPLDCFWEGSKPNGPFPPFEVPEVMQWFLESLPNVLSWKNLDPKEMLADIQANLQISEIDSVRSLFERAGIGRGYTNRPCLEPLDPECPKQAPNYLDFCAVVMPKFLQYNDQHHDLYKLHHRKLPVTSSPKNLHNSTDPNQAKTTLKFSTYDPNEDLGEFDSQSRSSSDDDNRKDKNCTKFGPIIRRLLLKDQRLYQKFVPDRYKVDFTKELTGGCAGFATNYMKWPEDLIVGGVKRDHDRIISIEALQSVYMLGSSSDVYNRFKNDPTGRHNLTVPWTKRMASEILSNWQRNYTDYIYSHVNNTEEARLLHPLAGTSVNDMLKEFSKFNPTVIIIGYVFMLVYASLSLCSCADGGVRSGVSLGLAGCLLVTFAGVAGLGCSTWLGITFNAATTQIVPFLTLGLGVDDMFLLVHNYKDIVKLANRNEIGFLLKETGLSALLTSLNNILSFLAGGLMPVPALRDFCLQVAILLFFNAVAILTMYPAMMSIDLVRRKNRRVDLFCCFQANDDDQSTLSYVVQKPPRPVSSTTALTNRVGSRDQDPSGLVNSAASVRVYDGTGGSCQNLDSVDQGLADCQHSSSQSYLTMVQPASTRNRISNINTSTVGGGGRSNSYNVTVNSTNLSNGSSNMHKSGWSRSFKHWTLHRFVKDYYVYWLTLSPVKFVILCVHLVILSFGIIGCTKVTLGLELTDVIPQGTAPYAFLDARDDYFSFYPFNAVLKGPMNIATKQALIREYRDSISRVSYVIKKDGKVMEQFWLQLMRQWLENLQEHFDADFGAKLFFDPLNQTVTSQGASEDAILALKLLCNAGHQLDCTRANRTRLIDQDGIINVDGFYNYLLAWYNQDPLTYYVSQGNFNPKPATWNFTPAVNSMADMRVPPAQDLIYSQIPFFLNHLTDTPAIVDMIQQIRAVCEHYNAKGLPNFPEGIAFTFWEQYLHLRWNLIVALLIVIGSVFVVISFLLMSPWTSAIVVVILVLLVVELAGFMGLVGLKLNAVSAVSLITAVGIGVEFTVHISLSYLTALGSRNERMVHTLDHMFIPVLHGGLSTLLGVIMLAFSEFEFIVRYFFMVMSALIVLGLLNGLLLLPVLLSLVGPQSEVRTVDGSHYLPPPSPPALQHTNKVENANRQCVDVF